MHEQRSRLFTVNRRAAVREHNIWDRSTGSLLKQLRPGCAIAL